MLLALRPEPRPTARRPPTCFGARGEEPRRTEFDLQGQYSCLPSDVCREELSPSKRLEHVAKQCDERCDKEKRESSTTFST